MTTEHEQRFTYTINQQIANTTDNTPTAAQVLADAGFEPAEDFVLIMRTAHGTKVVSSDDVLELAGSIKEFFAFETGTIFELTVNGHSIWWGSPQMDIPTIRLLGNVQEEDDLIWLRVDEEPETLALHGLFNLNEKGIEHLKTHKRHKPEVEYHYFVDGVKYHTDQPELTGAQIMAKIPDWDSANSLVLEGDGAEPDEVIRPSTIVELKGRETPAHFAIVPPATFGML